eukprot:289731-Pyramimonas_sp.AAC.1
MPRPSAYLMHCSPRAFARWIIDASGKLDHANFVSVAFLMPKIVQESAGCSNAFWAHHLP